MESKLLEIVSWRDNEQVPTVKVRNALSLNPNL